MKVLKFGGTSVGTVESLRNVKSIVESATEPVIVVVSALGGITDKLINTAKLACNRDMNYRDQFQEIIDRHHSVIRGIVPTEYQNEVLEIINPLLEDLSDIYKGVSLIRDLSERTLNIIVSFGERMSSVIVSRVIKDARHFDSLDFIKTEDWFGKNIADTELTNRLIHEKFDNADFKVALVPGFISRDRDTGIITNLGRGGSDYTAAILAAALNARVLEIWTDVDGFMTADPRIIKNAQIIDHLSFIESMELCNFGAKIIYPPTIYPVFHKNIPINLKNTFNPSAPGTWITDDAPASKTTARGISSINDTCMISVNGEHLTDNVDVIKSRILNTLSKNGVSILFVSHTSIDKKIEFAVRENDSKNAIKLLKEEFAADGLLDELTIENNLATIAIVGENIKQSHNLDNQLYKALEINNIKIFAYSPASSKINIAISVKADDLHKAMSLTHNFFF